MQTQGQPWHLLLLPDHRLTRFHGMPAHVEKAGMQISSQVLSPTFQPLCAGRLTTQLPPSAGTVATHPCGSSFTMNRVHSHSWEVSGSRCPEYFPISWPHFFSETLAFLEHYPPLPSVSVLFLHPQRPEAVASYRLLIIITIQMSNRTQLTVPSSVVSSTLVPVPQWHSL